MVEHEIHKHLHAALVRLEQQLAVVVERAESGVYREIILNVVAVIAVALLERREPQRVDAQLVKVIELADYALQIAHAVAVAVRKARHEYLVADRIVLPALRHGLLHVHVVVALVGNNVVRADRRPRLQSVVRVVHHRRFELSRTALRLALTHKPMIIALFARRVGEAYVNITAVVNPKSAAVYAAVLRKELNAELRRLVVRRGQAFVRFGLGIPPRIVVLGG